MAAAEVSLLETLHGEAVTGAGECLQVGKPGTSRLAPNPPSHRVGAFNGANRTSGDWCLGCSPRPLGWPGNVTVVGKESSAYCGFVFK